jgi:transcriptional regulator GlxA family with amidase domain
MTLTVGIYLFDEVEVLDFAGPFEVFSTASRVHSLLHPGNPKPFQVITIALNSPFIAARGGLRVHASHTIDNHPPIDILVIPGGVVSVQLELTVIIEWIALNAPKATLTASVCTGAFLLAKAGLLDGKTVTTHWEDIPDLRAMFPKVSVVEHQRWVDAGQIVTSGGISAGIDMSLYLVARLVDQELAVRTAYQMEFDWQHAAH